jgi:hypothetical protein
MKFAKILWSIAAAVPPVNWMEVSIKINTIKRMYLMLAPVGPKLNNSILPEFRLSLFAMTQLRQQ